IHT
ncbi:Type II restriction enzyme, methylase subunits (N-terminus), partial [Gloeomargarita lithophora Alchichica-D10]